MQDVYDISAQARMKQETMLVRLRFVWDDITEVLSVVVRI